MKPETQEAGAALSAITTALKGSSPQFRQTVLGVVAQREARCSIDEAFRDLYKSAEDMMPRSVDDLEDPRRYAASLLVLMARENKTRTKRDILFHVGKIFGHDKRVIDINDKRTYQDVIRSLKDVLGEGPVVDSTATVRAIGNGEAANGREGGAAQG